MTTQPANTRRPRRTRTEGSRNRSAATVPDTPVPWRTGQRISGLSHDNERFHYREGSHRWILTGAGYP